MSQFISRLSRSWKLIFSSLVVLLKLDYTRRARWPFRAFCVDGLHQITQYWCNYIKLAEIGNRTVTMSTFSWVLLENAKVSSFYSPKAGPIEKRDTQTTDGRTDGRTNKHQILGTLYTKGPKGQKLSHTSKTLFFVKYIIFHVDCWKPDQKIFRIHIFLEVGSWG